MTGTPSVETMRTTALLDSSDLIGTPQALRDRAEEHGYLFFRNLVPEEVVLDVRRRFLEIVDRHEWLAHGHDLMRGIADLRSFDCEQETEFCGVGVTPGAYREVQRVRQFHELAHHPQLLAIYADLFGVPVFPHPRNVARLMISGQAARPTPPHQDFIHFQGTSNAWTAWIPVGDCPRELGPLAVLDGSHKEGLLSYKKSEGAGGLEAYLCGLDLSWAQGDFGIGDVLTFHSQTVHRALPTQRPERVRLSCDFRYQPLHEEIDESSLKVHCDVLNWDEVYEGWPEGGIQWYWREFSLRRSEWDEELRWQKDRIC